MGGLGWPTAEGEITTTRLLKRRSVNMTHFLLAISLGMILLIIGMVFLLSHDFLQSTLTRGALFLINDDLNQILSLSAF
ncbi:MAG: hypothetical protein ACXADY_03160 [Candidatus Hodarchaeales archaeon]